ncbi:uncharacterized protein PHACADRAFT_262563 [Phanerochaete carnosa HHB-10118-sp]|uniref:RING-type domain-containing protein n=1 Tax=Phanerochaete carnosa (strain HHB-10118-sp) TaxID=650164 RepID=K5VZ28_PHACS|nr:uncharacterized protein PHACADRAFT_262563 [Phanerochaete carnosa HHB-10118-sp]EKM52100.1 hypothetical protein PHACADRAFT_262563 [Phanerochaete carnosa HHB-10118-sp]
MHIHAQQHREQQQQQAQAQQPGGPHPQRLPLPFNRISFTVDILPILGAPPGAAPAPGGNPQQPAPGRAAPPVFFELRFPFPPPAPAADGAQGDAPHVHRTPNEDFNAFLQSLRMGNMPWGPFAGFGAEEPEDPGRAKRLLKGLEQVPEGLVKRMEHVGTVEGEQIVCAVCFESLLNPEGVESAEEKMEVEAEGTPSPPDSDDDTSDQEKKAAEELDGKVIVLPCTHVFHASCLRPWFTRPHRTTCPTCRFDIDPESLTYVPPSRRSRPRRPAAQPAGQALATAAAGAQPQAQPQPADQAAVHNADSTPNVAPPPQPQAGAGAAPRPGLDAGRDMPYFVFDVSMFPISQPPRAPGQNASQQQQQQQQPQPQPQQPPALQVPVFGQPMPPPVAVPGHRHATSVAPPGIVRMDRNQLEQLILSRPLSQPNQDANQPASQPASSPPPQPQPQPQPQSQSHPAHSAQVQTQTGSRSFWQPFPLGAPPLGVHSGAGPQANPGSGSGLGSLFANMFGLGRGQQRNSANAQPQPLQPPQSPRQSQQPQQPQAQPAPEPQPQPQLQSQPQPTAAPGPQARRHHHNHPPLPSFEEFMHLVGLGPQPQQGQQDQQGQQSPPRPQQPAAAAAGVHPPHPHVHMRPPDGPFMDSVRDLATSVLEQLFPMGVFVPLPPRPTNGAVHPPPPPPGPIPFTVPNQPRPQQPLPEKRQWTPPAPPGPTLRERVERKERELGLRCSDISCGLGPSDEDPLPVVDPRTIRRVAIRPLKGQEHERDRACEHAFHPACLVSAERVAGWSGADQKREVEDGEVEAEVSCPVCRAVGVITREDWNEGACALA